MFNITVKDFVVFIIISIFVIFSAISLTENINQKSQIKQNNAQIEALQMKLSKCSATSNNIDIRKIKGKATAQIDQIIRLRTLDSLPVSTSCDTLRVVEWFCKLSRRERNFYEKLSEKY